MMRKCIISAVALSAVIGRSRVKLQYWDRPQMMNMAAQQLALNVWMTRHMSRIQEQIEVNGSTPCHIWTGKLREDGYSRYRYTCFYTGKPVNSTGHRVYYMLRKGLGILEAPHDMEFDYPGIWHVSHICHVNECLNMEHLSHEPAAVNAQRGTCKRNKKCYGHKPFSHCVAFGKW